MKEDETKQAWSTHISDKNGENMLRGKVNA